MPPEKSVVIEAALKIVQQKIARIKAELDDLSQSNAQNTKSTAGDKHDTERAMTHLEIEKLSHQLEQEKSILHDLEKINPTAQLKVIGSGSLVETSRGYFLIGAACGNVLVDDVAVFCISNHSPLAIQLIGKSMGDSVEVNSNNYSILSIH